MNKRELLALGVLRANSARTQRRARAKLAGVLEAVALVGVIVGLIVFLALFSIARGAR